MSNQSPLITNHRGQAYRYWREIFALAWKETELFSRNKILSTLGISILAFVLQWIDGVRAFFVTLQIIGTVIAAYLCVALISFTGKLILAPPIKDERAQHENEAFAKRLKPQLEITFDETKPEFVDRTKVTIQGKTWPCKLYRVAITSSISATTRLKIDRAELTERTMPRLHLRITGNPTGKELLLHPGVPEFRAPFQ